MKEGIFGEGSIGLNFSYYDNRSHMFKTDGTVTGTKKLFELPITEREENVSPAILFNDRLLTSQGQNYWMANSDGNQQYLLYKINGESLAEIGEVALSIPGNYPTVNSNSIRYLYDNRMNTTGLFTIYGNLLLGDDDFQIESYLWTIQDDQVQLKMSEANIWELANRPEILTSFPIDQNKVLVASSFLRIENDEEVYQVVFSLLNFENESITALDSLTEFPYEFCYAGAADGTIFSPLMEKGLLTRLFGSIHLQPQL
jgi:hypothetical protein